MLVRAPSTFLFILAICCWFRRNAAVPLAPPSSSQMQSAFKERESTLDSRFVRKDETLDVISEEEDKEDRILNSVKNVNQNWNINANIFDRGNKRHRTKHIHDERHKQSEAISETKEDVMAVAGQGTLEEMVSEEASTNCMSSSKKHQRYSSSFLVNSTDQTLTVDKEFHDVVGNNSKVKKSSSVHDGEDITLCWIEMTTIKEDKTVQPPKRLVIREYTISFENSATIPERYLECKRFEGELMANDPDVGKTALFEVIDEDTMVSRIVNFTSVSHVGNIIIWQHKKVKCGVGPVVSKNIIEITDDSKNPKKRVEIKVSPKINQLTAMTTEEPCTESTEHTTVLPCENGACEATSPSISKSEEIVSKLQTKAESESEDYTLSTVTKSFPEEEISRRSTTFPKISTTFHESHETIDCEENSSDPACLIHGTPSSEKLFPGLIVTTEVSTMEEATSAERSLISDREITTKEEISQSSIDERLEEITQSKEKKKISDLITKKTTLFPHVTDISTESSEEYVPQSTDEASVENSNTILSETKIASHSAIDVEEHSKFEESSGDGSIKLTSEELGEVISSSSAHIVTSEEVDTEPDVTTVIPPVEITEFTKEPDKPGQILDKLSEPPISTERVTGAIIVESSSMSEEVPSEESKESVTPGIEGTTSSEIDYPCENSEECASSESCDKFGNCGETTTKCDSEICSEEEVIKSKFDKIFPPMSMKIPPSDLQSPEKSTIIDTEYTTVSTSMLTSLESENWTADNKVPIMTETRRSTTTSTPQHKLTLKVKVLLEHINENKEKHNLVQVEKHLALDENPEHHGNPELLKQLKSLNDSVNMETISALLNCTSLGNLTRDSNFISKEPSDAVEGTDSELEFTNSEVEDSMSEQFISGSSEYRNHHLEKEPSRRRRRRSLDDEIEDLHRLVKRNLYNSTDSVGDSLNISQHAELTTDNLQLFTTTNYSEGRTINIENEQNVTKAEGDETTMSSTLVSIIDNVDFSNASESHNANLTKENVQLITTTNKPEEETNNTVHIENEKNITNERNESGVPSINETITNETKMEVVRDTLPGIQEDVVAGLRHMVSQLAQNNLATASNIKEAVKISLLDILADPKDTRVRLRRRRAATEEVGHWSNERIKEMPMGGNLRSVTEFTLYKVLR